MQATLARQKQQQHVERAVSPLQAYLMLILCKAHKASNIMQGHTQMKVRGKRAGGHTWLGSADSIPEELSRGPNCMFCSACSGTPFRSLLCCCSCMLCWCGAPFCKDTAALHDNLFKRFYRCDDNSLSKKGCPRIAAAWYVDTTWLLRQNFPRIAADWYAGARPHSARLSGAISA